MLSLLFCRLDIPLVSPAVDNMYARTQELLVQLQRTNRLNSCDLISSATYSAYFETACAELLNVYGDALRMYRSITSIIDGIDGHWLTSVCCTTYRENLYAFACRLRELGALIEHHIVYCSNGASIHIIPF